MSEVAAKPDDTIAVLNFILSMFNVGLASMLVLRGFSVNQQIGAASVTAAAQKTYQELRDTKDGVNSLDDADQYYDRFWAGQILQYEQWRSKMIPDLIYEDWLTKRRDQYRRNSNLFGITFQDSWRLRHDARYKHTRFGKFMHCVLTEGPPPTSDAHNVLKHVRTSMIRDRFRFG